MNEVLSPFGRLIVERINAYDFYQAGIAIHALSGVQAGQTIRDVLNVLWGARSAVDALIADKYVALVVCKSSLNGVRQAIGYMMPEDVTQLTDAHLDAKVEEWHPYWLGSAMSNFEVVFSAELRGVDTYFVKQKGIFSTPLLIEHAENIFAENIRNKLTSQALADFRQAGRCLAFECPTAAAFHILRSVEAMLREYYQVVTGVMPKKKLRNWGAYIGVLSKSGGEPKILGILDQIRELHRNPIIHPEDNLTTEDVLTLLGIAQSAMVAIVMDIEKRKAATLSLPGIGP